MGAEMLYGILQDLVFVADSGIVQSGSCPHAHFQRRAGQQVHPNGRRRGVANSHFAYADDVTAPFVAFCHHAGTGFYASVRFLFRHGRFVKEVPCTTCYFTVDDAGIGMQIVVHSHVKTVLAAEHIYSASPVAEVNHLLPGDFARGYADSFAFDSMVGTEQQVARVAQFR